MVAKYKFQLEQKMEGYDRLLGRQKFMAGDVSPSPGSLVSWSLPSMLT